MTPYYERAGISVWCCRHDELLPTLAAGTFDVAFADPPYHQTSLAWDKWPPGWVAEVARVIETPGALWCWGSLRMFMEHAAEFACLKLAQDVVVGSPEGDGLDVVVEKQNGSSFHRDRFRRVHEQAAHFYQGKWSDLYRCVPTTPDAVKKQVRRKQRPPHLGEVGEGRFTSEDGGPRLMRSVLRAPNCHGFAENETQKSVEACEPLFDFSARPGAHVLSVFAGSGTDAEIMFRRGLTGCVVEMREQQCEVIARRLSALLPFSGQTAA